MRGRILQYNSNDGTGIVVVDGQQQKFAIAMWKGDTAPAVGKTVEVVVADGQVQTVMLVSEEVLLREKTAELTGKLGSLVSGLASSVSKEGGGGVALGGSIIDRYGKPTLIAYAVFLIGTTIFKAISISNPILGGGMGWSMFDLAGFLSMTGSGGGIKAMLILSYLSIAVPFFWRDRRAWLALLLPVLTCLWALLKARSAMGGGFGPGGGGPSLTVLGFYLPCVAALYLGVAGVKKYLTAA
jgi:hypothetical protein